MTSREAEFLRLIADEPENREHRLVFADWLEEQGDERAELIRIEEHLRTLVPYEDEYWRLKPRRNALRRRCDDGFLRQMDYGQVYLPVFTQAATEWRHRWRLLREMTERWYRVAMPDVGRITDDAVTLAKSLGRELPASILEWMAFTEDLFEPGRQAAAEMLRDGRRIEDFPGYASLSLNLQAEGDVHWAVAYASFDQADPPVSVYYLNYEDETTFAIDQDSTPMPVTEFAISYLTAYFGGHTGFGSEVESASDLLEELRDSASCTRWGDIWIIEGRGWLATLSRGRTAFGTRQGDVTAYFQRNASPADVPPALRRLNESAFFRIGRAED